MADFKDKLSHLISQQAPDFVLEDHPYFLEFVKEYYKFLESAEMTLTDIGDPDHIQLETQTATNNFLQLSGTNQQKDDSGDRILLEDTSYGDFINGETITGQTSGATATVLVEDIDGGSRLFVSHQNKFEIGELIIGSTSGAEATIATYKANPVQNIQQLLDYPDPDKTIQSFLTKFRNAFLQSIPDSLGTGVDKRKLIKNIKSLYRAKGTKRASEIFFKLLFNENAEIRFPKENILRASDGKWDTERVIRCTEVGTSNATHLIGQVITQANDPGDININEATAIVENVFKYEIGGETVVELVLGESSITGTFITGQNITGTDNTDEDILVTCTIQGIIATKTITNDGAFYNQGDTVNIAGGGNDAIIQVDTIGSGSISEIIINSGGTGYEIGDTVNFSTGNAIAKVSVVNGGIAPEDATGFNFLLEDNLGKLLQETSFEGINAFRLEDGDIDEMILLEDGSLLLQEENTDAAEVEIYDYFTQEGTFTANEDHIVLEDETLRGDPYTGNKIVQEVYKDDGLGGAEANTGDITDVRLIYEGNGYTSLPTLTITSSGGSSASIFANSNDIGRVLNLKTIELGSNYDDSPSPPTLTLPTYLLLTNRSGSFIVGETITGLDSSSEAVTATVVSFDTDTSILKCSGATGTFAESTTITGGTSLQTANVYKNDQATATSTVNAIATTDGKFINQDGWISETSMRIQDSLLYQDYSYIVRVGRSINDWRDTYTQTLHSAGFYFQGEVTIETQISARIKDVTGINTSVTEEIFGVYKTIFTTILGRRLGTSDDGTTLRSNPALGVDPDFTDSTSEHFTPNTRDLTLTRSYTLIFESVPKITIDGDTTKHGYAFSGPRLGNINKYWQRYSGSGIAQTTAVGADSTVASYITPMTMANWANHRIIGTQTNSDGEVVEFTNMTDTPDLKTYVALPTEISISY